VDGDPRPLHELTHHRGHTLIVLGGPQAGPGRVSNLVAELEGLSGAAVDAVVGLSTHPDGPQVGRIDESVAAQLGVVAMTVLGVRPDRYIGLRDGSGDPSAVRHISTRWSRRAPRQATATRTPEGGLALLP
jgi:hypothetical protein